MKFHRYLFPLLLIAVVVGCMPPPPHKEESAPPPPAPPPYVFHKVMPGETLATIAKWYSGKESNWPEIAEHNKELNPSSLKVGDVVKVPAYLATVHNEQPNFSTAPHRTKKKAASENEEVPPGPDEVFGPK